jgi:hypothetical protein
MSTVVSEVEARRILGQLAQADSAVRCFPEPRSGPGFEDAQRRWAALYARALDIGHKFEAEDR